MKARDLTKKFVADYAANWAKSDDASFVHEANSISMLGKPTLSLLRLFGRLAAGPVLEIGPYIGGSTVAIAQGLKDSGKGQIITLELGGAYKSHPSVPSLDIFKDLEQNLSRFGVRDLVEIISGRPNAFSTMRKVRGMLRPKSLKMLMADLDGCVGKDFWAYEPYMADDCLIVFDDYTSPGSDKGPPTKAFVDRAVRRGLIEDLGVYEWGTWFGRLKRRPTTLERALWAPYDFWGPSGVTGVVKGRLKMWRKFGKYYPPYDM
jgi:predicted O-methyltransferase YrrM